MRDEMLEYPPLDKHEARTRMPHLDHAILSGFGGVARHVEHEGSAVSLKVRLARRRCGVDLIPIDFLLRVDTASDISIGGHQLRHGVPVEGDIRVDEHQVVEATLKKDTHKLVTSPRYQTLVHHLRPEGVDP